MWIYEKKLQFPVNIKKPNPRLAKVIISQFGGPDGELGAAIRYISQRFTMVTPEAKAILNDIGRDKTKMPASLCHPSVFITLGYVFTARFTECEAMDILKITHDKPRPFGSYSIFMRGKPKAI